MSRLRKIAEIPAGSWTKWLVVGLWLVVVAVAYPLQSKLMGAEKNDTSAWLPASAESVKVLDVGRWMWWPSTLARTPDPAPAELGQERTAALAGEMALQAGGLS